MLQIDKSEVEFLVTAHMVDEVRTVLQRDFPKVDELVQRAVDQTVERVYFIACGSPLCACQTAQQLFSLYSDIPCQCFSGQDFLDATPKKLDEHCLVVGVSQSGTTEEVVGAVKLAQAQGAMTIALTKAAGTPLAQYAQAVIAYGAECIWEVHLLLTYRIALSLLATGNPSPDVAQILLDLEKLPEILEELLLSAEENAKRLGLMAAKWPLVYTVAAGPLLPMAYKEGVITMLEFTRTHGCSLNASEFRHGPLEMAEQDVAYVMLLGTDPSRSTVKRVERFVQQYSNRVISFDFEELSHGLHPMLAPFVLFVPLEYFYYYLALGKNHNPDDRRYYGGLAEF